MDIRYALVCMYHAQQTPPSRSMPENAGLGMRNEAFPISSPRAHSKTNSPRERMQRSALPCFFSFNCLVLPHLTRDRDTVALRCTGVVCGVFLRRRTPARALRPFVARYLRCNPRRRSLAQLPEIRPRGSSSPFPLFLGRS
jgi:hypothetical protein